MAKKPQRLSDAEIVSRVSEKASKAVSWYDTRLSRERERVIRYYNGILPRRQHDGSSSYVSTDVYDAVETKKTEILEVFSGSDEIAQFDPDQDMDVNACKDATQYARYVIFRQNLATTTIFPSVIHDGLTARAGVVKVYWEKNSKRTDENFQGLSHDDAYGLASQEDVEEFDAEEQPDGTYAGTLTRAYDASSVRIDTIAPEEFLIERGAVSLALAKFTGHRTKKTRAALKEMGFDPKKVDEVSADERQTISMTPEVQARFEETDDGATETDDPADPQLQEVAFYECYMQMVIDQAKGARLYKICYAGTTLLDDPQEVDKAPFMAYVPLPVPHVFYGNSFAARVIPVQNARTVLTRAVLDHASITTNPRWLVVNGGLLNPKEMLENRLGGIVNARRPDSVSALQYPNLNPFVFQVLGMLKEDKEQSTGISALSQGLNKDAISKQNAQGLVDNLVSLSSQRGKIAARQFAGFLSELMIEVVRLAILNSTREQIIEVAGSEMQVDPRQWTERSTCSVSMHLGYGEKDQALAKLMNAYQFMAGDAAIAPMFTVENRYELLRDAMKLANMNGASRYLTHPSKVQPPEPDPLEVKKVEAVEKKADAALITAQTDAAVAQAKVQIDGGKLTQKNQELVLKAIGQDRDNDRKDLDSATKTNVSMREMALAETVEKQQAYIAPNN
jgi:hypothetical protein